MTESSNKEDDSLIHERKCPSCGSILKEFTLEGKQVPFDPIGLFAIQQSSKVNLLPIWTVGDQHLDDIILICCQSICKNCGLISSWRIDSKEFFTILKSNDYKIYSLYSKKSFNKILASNDVDEKYKKIAKDVLKLLENKYYE